MKKLLRILLLLAVLLLPNAAARADSPYTTWAMGPGFQLYMTQDAYVPYTEIDLDFEGGEDLFVTEDGAIYIADSDEGQIVKLVNFQVTERFGEDVLESPTGLFVDEAGMMYITDAKKNTVVILDAEGNLVKEFGRPTEPLFGKNREFLPRKITVDKRQNLYIISEGSVNGVVQMNTNGAFIGYFGANASTMSLKMILQRTFLTEEQLAQFIKNEAASPSNIAIDHQSLVYTITGGIEPWLAIRKFTIAGKNIFPEIWGSSTFRDITVDESGLVLAVDADGQIYEYDMNGMLLFVFGALDNEGGQRLGTLRSPTAIARHGEQIYVLDKDKQAIVVYETTAFAQKVHEGVRLYMEGFYGEAKPHFEEVLNFNGSFLMSYQAIADAYYQERDYENALASYRYAEDQSGYSQAYWEMRNAVLQRYLSSALLWIVGLSMVRTVTRRLDRRYGWFEPVRAWWRGLRRYKLVDDFAFMFDFIRHPVDSFYYIKKNLRGSVLFAMLLYLWVIAVRILTLYFTGFIFSDYPSPAFIRAEDEIVQVVALLFLWNAANYLISTISDGEGRVRDVVIGTAYSLFPYALFALPIALISNVLTYNEVFLYEFSLQIMTFWIGLMLFIMVKEIHNYSFGETVRNILLTLFTMALFVLTGYILYVLFSQLFDFITAILQEVRIRG